MPKSRRPRLLVVGGFPRPGHTVYGGIVTASQALLRSGLGERFDIVPFDSTQASNPPPGLLVRTGLAALRFARFVARVVFHRPDAVMLFAATGFSLIEKGAMAWVCRLLRLPVAIFPRGGASIEMAARSAFNRAWTRWALAGADKVLCQGPAWQRFVVGLGDHDPHHAPIIENWTATDELCAIGAARVQEDLPTVRLLFVGWLEKDKGVGDLLEACARLRPSHDFVLQIAGDGAYREEAQRLVDSNGLGQTVRFLGWLKAPQLVELYRRSDVFVLPSWAEGFPNALIEAMAAGLPAVVTTVGNIPDLVGDGVEALLVPPKDVGALAAALEAVLIDPRRRQALGSNAHALAKARFSIDAAVEKLDLAITEMIS
jgi:glycosyltransferase involved in cell wall biosynthesis